MKIRRDRWAKGVEWRIGGKPANARMIAAVMAVAALVTASCGEASSSDASASAAASELLYVLDPNHLADDSEVHVVDPESAQVVKTFPAAADPMMTVSPDGSRLFVASSDGVEDRLQVIDTSSGEVVASAPVHDRFGFTLPAYFPTMATSSDGRWVFVLGVTIDRPNDASYSLSTFDVRRGEFLPSPMRLGRCGAGALQFPAAGRMLHMLCPATSEVVSVEMSDNGRENSRRSVEVPRASDSRTDQNRNSLRLGALGGGALDADDRLFYAVTQNGQVSKVDVASGRVVETADLGLSDEEYVPLYQTVVAPDGSTLYVGTGRIDAFNRFVGTSILVVDASTLEVESRIETSRAFTSLALGESGGLLYAIDGVGANVMIVDTADGAELSVVSGVGTNPTLGVVAPRQ